MAPETRFPVSYADVVTLVEEECVAHRQHTLDKVATGLRARAETADAGDPLVAALLSGCHTVGGVVVADPIVIARAAYKAVAALLDPPAADGVGQHRTDPSVTSDPRTEAGHEA